MKIFIALILGVLSFTNIHAQEEVFSFLQDDQTTFNRKKDGFSFSNNLTGELAIVFIDREHVFANLFDKDFNLEGTVTGYAQKEKFSNLLGYKINNRKYVLLSSNSSMKKFTVQILEFDTGNTFMQELDIDLGKEKFLETIHYKNDLFIITATKKNELVLRKLSESLNFEEIKRFTINVEKRNERFFFFDLLGKATSNIVKVDNRVPNTLEQTAKDNKLYQIKNKVYVTIESDKELLTTLHIVDLESLTLTTKTYPYPKGEIGDFKVFNSFLLEDKIIQLGCSYNEMKLVIKNLDNSIVKTHYLEKDVPIAIKNSPIIQQGPTTLGFKSRREMEETSKYLKKISSGKLGVTAYRNGDTYSFTIGGYKLVSSGGGMMMSGGGFGATSIQTGGGAVFVPAYNPTFVSYNNSSSTKSTYFNTTFDEDFNYVEKEAEANIFERIKEFKKDIKYETAEDVFFHQDDLFFGYYNTKEKKYHLYKM